MSFRIHSLTNKLQQARSPRSEEKGNEEERGDDDMEKGVEVPSPGEFKPEEVSEDTQEDSTDVDITYPLVPTDPE